jgi:hypothetical protein
MWRTRNKVLEYLPGLMAVAMRASGSMGINMELVYTIMHAGKLAKESGKMEREQSGYQL